MSWWVVWWGPPPPTFWDHWVRYLIVKYQIISKNFSQNSSIINIVVQLDSEYYNSMKREKERGKRKTKFLNFRFPFAIVTGRDTTKTSLTRVKILYQNFYFIKLIQVGQNLFISLNSISNNFSIFNFNISSRLTHWISIKYLLKDFLEFIKHWANCQFSVSAFNLFISTIN